MFRLTHFITTSFPGPSPRSEWRIGETPVTHDMIKGLFRRLFPASGGGPGCLFLVFFVLFLFFAI